MLKYIYFMLLFSIYTLAIEINTDISYKNILAHSEVYIDHDNSITIDTIDNQEFSPITQPYLGLGYAPDLKVWIRFTLTNTSDIAVKKILEYDNPLTSYMNLFDKTTHTLLKKEGLFQKDKDRDTLHPTFPIELKAFESKTYYIQAYSEVTTLIIKLKLWNPTSFYSKELKYQFILALFFGAMGIIIIYNFFIYLATREKSYLYYVLAFIGITIHYLLYKGVAGLYIIPPTSMKDIIPYAPFIVLAPIFFLALFTKHIFTLINYPKYNTLLNISLIIFPITTVGLYFLEINKARSLPAVLFLLLMLYITFNIFKAQHRQAKFILVGWIVFFSSGLFMFLSSYGIYDIFTYVPHYSEVSLVIEAMAFSLSLADKIKQLTEIEKSKLQTLVDKKTKALQQSLAEKELLLDELNHRVKNSMQTIISFLNIQIDTIDHQETQRILRNMENRIFAINDLYALLHTSENITTVNMHKYFSLLVTHVQNTFDMPHIDMELYTDISLHPKDAIYCGLIVNEAITNAYQHAFANYPKGEITVTLLRKNSLYSLTIKDTGKGLPKDFNSSHTLGMIVIETLAMEQLEGTLTLSHNKGTIITIEWREDEH